MRKLTNKEERFVGEYLSNRGNATATALAVYDCNAESARRIGSENLTKIDIVNAIQRHTGNILQEAFGALQDALKAETKTGLPHHNVRLRAVEMIFKLCNAYPYENADENVRVVRGYKEFGEWWDQQPITVIEFMEKENRLPDEEESPRLIAEAESGSY